MSDLDWIRIHELAVRVIKLEQEVAELKEQLKPREDLEQPWEVDPLVHICIPKPLEKNEFIRIQCVNCLNKYDVHGIEMNEPFPIPCPHCDWGNIVEMSGRVMKEEKEEKEEPLGRELE